MTSRRHSQRFRDQTGDIVTISNRMPFGIASGPEEYQRRQHEFLDGLRGVIDIADDICVFGCGDTKEEADIDHDRNLTNLVEKCSNHDQSRAKKRPAWAGPGWPGPSPQGRPRPAQN